MEGRTPVPEKEQLASLAAHGATMVIFLSIGLIDKVQQALLAGGAYTPETPAAVVYKASWPEQKVVRCTVGTLAGSTRANGTVSYTHLANEACNGMGTLTVENGQMTFHVSLASKKICT